MINLIDSVPGRSPRIEDAANEVVISAATIWEIAIKTGLGKSTLSVPYREWMDRAIADLRSTILPITVEHADVQARLPSHHRDPFDRMLIAQAMAERIPQGDRLPYRPSAEFRRATSRIRTLRLHRQHPSSASICAICGLIECRR